LLETEKSPDATMPEKARLLLLRLAIVTSIAALVFPIPSAENAKFAGQMLIPLVGSENSERNESPPPALVVWRACLIGKLVEFEYPARKTFPAESCARPLGESPLFPPK
jgi:hypothetical protein